MKDNDNIHFEIRDSGDLVRIEPIESVNYNSNIDWDQNWIKTKVTLRGGNFSGEYYGEFMTVDFEKLKQDLKRIYNDLKGSVYFNDLEGYLELKINGDGIGHFEVEVKGCDKPGIYGSILTFTLAFDQTQINEMVNQLNLITREFPTKGNIKT